MPDTENIAAESSPQESEGTGQRTRFIILGAVLALAVGYMVYAAFPGNALYFLTVSEFMARDSAQDGRTVRVAGKLVDGSFLREENSTVANFRLTDNDGELVGQQLNASYLGVLPDLFFNPHSEVILEGSYGTDRVFQVNNVLVKCPSKYQSVEQEQEQRLLN